MRFLRSNLGQTAELARLRGDATPAVLVAFAEDPPLIVPTSELDGLLPLFEGLLDAGSQPLRIHVLGGLDKGHGEERGERAN